MVESDGIPRKATVYLMNLPSVTVQWDTSCPCFSVSPYWKSREFYNLFNKEDTPFLFSFSVPPSFPSFLIIALFLSFMCLVFSPSFTFKGNRV